MARAPQKPPPSQKQGTSIRDSFERINRNDKDRHIDMSDLVGAHRQVPKDVRIRGDKNGDNRLNFDEFKAAYTRATEGTGGSGEKTTREHHVSYIMPEGQSATLRTHSSGLVHGRVNAGDTFVASHKKDNWVYGHVKGHPDRKGWVLAEQLPGVKGKDLRDGELRANETSRNARRPTESERARSTNKTVDWRDRSDFEYLDGKDRKAIKYLQGGLDENFKGRVGYTTPVQRVNPKEELKVYTNYPCKPGNELMRNGKPLTIPVGKDVQFRYTPDGKHAVVLARPGREQEGKPGTEDYKPRKDGVWGIIPIEKLNIPEGTPGYFKPGEMKHPFNHR